jgi:hypothetical protein
VAQPGAGCLDRLDVAPARAREARLQPDVREGPHLRRDLHHLVDDVAAAERSDPVDVAPSFDRDEPLGLAHGGRQVGGHRLAVEAERPAALAIRRVADDETDLIAVDGNAADKLPPVAASREEGDHHTHTS